MIKYKIDIMEALKNAGYSRSIIKNKKIISEGVMQKICHNDTDLTLKTINTLCILLDCQPSDLIEFKFDSYVDTNINL